jgi:hypothetical protein
MTPFLTISARAHNSRLNDSHNIYLTSEAFQKRIEFKGASGLTDLVNMQCYLLGRLALDSRNQAALNAELDRGVVNLFYFGISNPAPFFELEVGSLELNRLKTCVNANLAGPLVKARSRVLKWRAAKKALKNSARKDSICRPLRESYPTVDRTNPTRAVEQVEAWRSTLDAKYNNIQDLRNARLAKLSQGTAPGLASWTDLLDDIVLNVLQPLVE